MKAAFILIVALLVSPIAGCMQGPSRETDPNPVAEETPATLPLEEFSFAGDECRELGVTLRVDASRARAFVPSQYMLVGEPAGIASFTIAVGGARLVGEDPGSGVYSNLGFLVEPPMGQGPPEHYLLGASSTKAQIVEDAKRLGFPMALLPNASVHAASLAGAAQAIVVFVDHPEGPYQATGRSPSVGPPFPATPTNNWWWRSENQTIQFEYRPILETTQPVEVTVEATSGSDIAYVLGGTTASGAALYSTLSFTAAARTSANAG